MRLDYVAKDIVMTLIDGLNCQEFYESDLPELSIFNFYLSITQYLDDSVQYIVKVSIPPENEIKR